MVISQFIRGLRLAVLLSVCLLLLAPAVSYSDTTNTSAGIGHRLDTPNFNKNTLNTSSNTQYTAQFYNWSGYAASGTNPFNEVQASYTQPSITCPTQGAWTVYWVGFDGYNNSNVEQAGTASQCDYNSPSKPTYYAWWEMYPTNYIQEMPITVNPGDGITDTVRYNAKNKEYILTVTDRTTQKHFTQITTCASNITCARSTAEWIVERPSVGSYYTNLADWGTMNISSAKASNTLTSTGNPINHPISYFTNYGIDMVNDPYTGEIMANVSTLNTTGNGFSDKWDYAQ